MEPGGTKVVSWPVLEGITVELVTASFWSTAAQVRFDNPELSQLNQDFYPRYKLGLMNPAFR